MPTPTGHTGRPAASSTRDRASSPEPRGSRWLLSLNLFMLALVLAGAAALAWMTMNFIQPANDVIVPNLVGRTLTEAQALAAERRFVLSTVDDTKYLEAVPADTIYKMSPAPGRQIRENKPVQIWVSRGPKLIEIPDVRDMAIDRANRVIQARGFHLGAKDGEYDPLAAKGNVLRQSPDPGENRPRGTAVDLVLSKGEEPPPPPVPIPDMNVGSPNGATSDNPGNTTDPGTTGMMGEGERTFAVRYHVPNDAASHRIRIDVVDSDGTRTVYDERRDAGERIQEEVQGVGRHITIRLYDNDELQSDVTK